MITDEDVTKLKKTFVTKLELKHEIKKESNRIINIMVKEFKTVFEMIGDTNERMDKRFAEMDKRFDDLLKRQEVSDRRADYILDELKHNRIVLGNHEERIQKVESNPTFV